jgi:hypothetical protein
MIAPLRNNCKHVHEEVRYNMHIGVCIGHGNRSNVEMNTTTFKFL